jgi:glycosyltransferase involved in cell wall biosynthesis
MVLTAMTSGSVERPERIVFVINSLVGGGAERVLSGLLAHLAAPGSPLGQAELHLVQLDRCDEKYPVPATVQRHGLDARGRFVPSVVQLTRKLSELRPTAVLSFLSRANCANVIAARFLGYRCIISERTNTAVHLSRGVGGWINRLLVRALYPRAAHVVAVSAGVAQGLVRDFGIRPGRISVIHNPYDLDAIRRRASSSRPVVPWENYVVSVGRLIPSKDHGMLIRAFALAELGGDLVILGEGEERAHLEAVALEAGLGGRVHLPGHVEDLFPIVAGARMFAIASRYEGFPNATAEAMALGRPVVSTACDFGPAELLQGETPDPGTVGTAACGLLVPVGDVGAMAEALRRLADPATGEQFGKRAARRMEDFRVEAIAARYAEIIRHGGDVSARGPEGSARPKEMEGHGSDTGNVRSAGNPRPVPAGR